METPRRRGKKLAALPADPPARGHLFRKQAGGLDFLPDVSGPAKGVQEDRLARVARLRDVADIPVAGLAEPAGAEDERAQRAKHVDESCARQEAKRLAIAHGQDEHPAELERSADAMQRVHPQRTPGNVLEGTREEGAVVRSSGLVQIR